MKKSSLIILSVFPVFLAVMIMSAVMYVPYTFAKTNEAAYFANFGLIFDGGEARGVKGELPKIVGEEVLIDCSGENLIEVTSTFKVVNESSESLKAESLFLFPLTCGNYARPAVSVRSGGAEIANGARPSAGADPLEMFAYSAVTSGGNDMQQTRRAYEWSFRNLEDDFDAEAYLSGYSFNLVSFAVESAGDFSLSLSGMEGRLAITNYAVETAAGEAAGEYIVTVPAGITYFDMLIDSRVPESNISVAGGRITERQAAISVYDYFYAYRADADGGDTENKDYGDYFDAVYRLLVKNISDAQVGDEDKSVFRTCFADGCRVMCALRFELEFEPNETKEVSVIYSSAVRPDEFEFDYYFSPLKNWGAQHDEIAVTVDLGDYDVMRASSGFSFSKSNGRQVFTSKDVPTDDLRLNFSLHDYEREHNIKYIMTFVGAYCAPAVR